MHPSFCLIPSGPRKQATPRPHLWDSSPGSRAVPKVEGRTIEQPDRMGWAMLQHEVARDALGGVEHSGVLRLIPGQRSSGGFDSPSACTSAQVHAANTCAPVRLWPEDTDGLDFQ
ncbi:hypothetical protein DPX16_22418 [Anabarilius grahami]|uniref:Uncharacterized protein n=1 Tax=Anabarilius grahami TaxID=495550 RepID=A0A3N0YZ95_ANAGA|nr:hypothetical protein DPX16_22418 [Anabarilius grahami]